MRAILLMLGLYGVVGTGCSQTKRLLERHHPDDSMALSQDGTAVDGGWVSGGGSIIGDAANPWFLQNTETVNYCLLIDGEHFSVDPHVIRQRIQGAIAYWKKYFTAMGETKLFETNQKIRIASQTFVEGPCDDNTDLRFQFGVLTPAQESYLKNPRSFVAASVRTSYDQAQLRGKGFIYVSPLSGPLALARVMSDRMWMDEESVVLELALAHELGHVFGVPHIGNNEDSLMHEYNLDRMAEIDSPLVAKWVLRDPTELKRCNRRIIDLIGNPTCALNLKDEDDCVEFKRYEIFGSKGASENVKSRGHIEVDDGGGSLPVVPPFMRLTITGKQQVFAGIPKYRDLPETFPLWDISPPFLLVAKFRIPESNDPLPMTLRINQLSTEFTTTRPGQEACSFVFEMPLPTPFLFFN